MAKKPKPNSGTNRPVAKRCMSVSGAMHVGLLPALNTLKLKIANPKLKRKQRQLDAALTRKEKMMWMQYKRLNCRQRN